MLTARRDVGVRLDWPVFPDSIGGHRDPNNTLKILRKIRAKVASLTCVRSHNFRNALATILDGDGQAARRLPTTWGTAGSRWPRKEAHKSSAAKAMDAVLGAAAEHGSGDQRWQKCGLRGSGRRPCAL